MSRLGLGHERGLIGRGPGPGRIPGPVLVPGPGPGPVPMRLLCQNKGNRIYDDSSTKRRHPSGVPYVPIYSINPIYSPVAAKPCASSVLRPRPGLISVGNRSTVRYVTVAVSP